MPHRISESFDKRDVAGIVSAFKDQETMVDSFVSTGRLEVEDETSRWGFDALIIGERNPLRIKIEVTHAWGRPVVHCLISEDKMLVLYFPDKTIYSGRPGRPSSSPFFFDRMELSQLWGLLRGFPVLPKGALSFISEGPGIIPLDKEGRALQRIKIDAETLVPRSVNDEALGLETVYPGFEDRKGILYAGKRWLKDLKNNNKIRLSSKKISFNQPLPEAVFDLKIPHDFREMPLDRLDRFSPFK